MKEAKEFVSENFNGSVEMFIDPQVIKSLWEENQRYKDALEFIEFRTHFRCETYNGKSCDLNTQEAYEESLKSIRATIEQALNTEVK